MAAATHRGSLFIIAVFASVIAIYSYREALQKLHDTATGFMAPALAIR